VNSIEYERLQTRMTDTMTATVVIAHAPKQFLLHPSCGVVLEFGQINSGQMLLRDRCFLVSHLGISEQF